MVMIGCNYISLKPIIISKWEKQCEKPNSLLYDTIEIFKSNEVYLIVNSYLIIKIILFNKNNIYC
ncbi:MAG: hypothetical protein RL259_1596 [Bacteroidota bacterium]|jgi:hypothetical protein